MRRWRKGFTALKVIWFVSAASAGLLAYLTSSKIDVTAALLIGFVGGCVGTMLDESWDES